MSADFHVLVVDEINVTPDEVREYGQLTFMKHYPSEAEEKRFNVLQRKIYGNSWELMPDNQWLGAVSWLGRGLPNNFSWVPRSVEYINRLFDNAGGMMKVTPSVVAAITVAYNLPHDSWYETVQWTSDGERFRMVGVARARDVKKFLTANMGKYVFVDTF